MHSYTLPSHPSTALFRDQLQLLCNPVCGSCDARYRNPLLPWVVGNRFDESPERVVFVGKPHRGLPGDVQPLGYIDPSALVEDELWHKPWPYWRYTREIAERLYGPEAQDFIAMTNLIKCSSVSGEPGAATHDNTTRCMAESCINKLGVIWKEVEALKAKTVVFYTFGLYRDFVETLPFALEGSILQVTNINHTIPCRNKRLGWWERRCKTAWTNDMRILVVGHPERMANAEFVDLLSQWIRPS